MCKFPFEHRGKVYHTCTYDHSEVISNHQPWCATEIKAKNSSEIGHVTGWGVCNNATCKNDLSKCKYNHVIAVKRFLAI